MKVTNLYFLYLFLAPIGGGQDTIATLLLLVSSIAYSQVPDLGASSTFALFTAAGAFNGDAATSVVGDIGTNVGAFTPPGFLVGQIHLADPVSAQAAADVGIAYGQLAGLTCGAVLATPLGNSQVLAPNIYCLATASVLNADLILDGGGDPGAIFIFQVNGALSTNPSSQILLINGANLCNVYWQINGAFNGGGNTLFQGTIIAEGAINLANGAVLSGRGLSTAGAISTSANVVQLPNGCLCTLEVTCPSTFGGSFSCINNIPPGAASDVTIESSCGATQVAITQTASGTGCLASPYVLVRTYTVTDNGGNSTACEVTYNATDNTAPMITCPTVAASIECPAAPTFPAATATDGCGGTPSISSMDVSTPSGICTQEFSVTRTWTATDACGNTSTCSRTIAVTDNTAPVITCPSVSASVECPAVPTFPTATATDACGGVPIISAVNVTTPSGICPQEFSVSRTWTATDACGNTSTCSRTIAVTDNTVPVITCPTVTATIECPAVPTFPTAASATDACGGIPIISSVSVNTPSGICPQEYSVTRTWTATDACGNTSSCSRTIAVTDNTAPTFINSPANITVECFAGVPIPTPPTATDLCSGAVPVILISQDQVPSICPNLYTITRIWRATDNCGNSATVSQVMTVVDTYAPQFTQNAMNVVLDCNVLSNQDSFQNWLNNQGGAVVSDCGMISWTFMDSPFFFMPSTCGGTSKRFIRFTATDECGNSAFQDASFTIVDLTPPAFTILPQNIKVECTDGANGDSELIDWLENFGYAAVRDDCGEVFTEIAFLSEYQGCANTFTRNYQFRATDECGNTNYVMATFEVIDTTAPVIVTCPEGNVLLTCIFDIPAPNTAGVVAWDNCGGPLTVTVMDSFSVGVGCGYWPLTKSYTYAVADACGNISTCYQSFQVVDSIPPVYTGPDTITVLCVADLPGLGEIADIIEPWVVDNCYNIICVYEAMDSSGVNSITFCVKVKDICGNWTDKFMVTFIATGGCRPLCTAPQTTWSNTAGLINGIATSEVITQLIEKNGPIKAGKLGKTIEVSSATCLQNMLSIEGTTAHLGHGNFEFGAFNDCQTTSSILHSDGTLKNKLVSNVLAMQLNIWYNQEFNERDLGVQALSTIPLCLIDEAVMNKLEVNHSNVQGLLNLSNYYLAGIGSFQPGFGNLINDALNQVNNYWRNCETNDPCAGTISVSGTLKTESQEGLEEGRVRLDGSYNTIPLPNQYGYSDVTGAYAFSNAIPFASNYQVIPTSENMSHVNGVTTYDLVLISKHLLGIAPLTSPYKMIAADANKSGSITTFDILELRKLILGLYDELPENTAWRFVDKSYVFPTPENPFAPSFPEYKTVGQELQNEQDFVSIKVGDLNNSAQANGLLSINDRSEGVLLFDLNNRVVKNGEIFDVTMTADQPVQGFQFTLHTGSLEVLEVSGAGMSAANFAVYAATGEPSGKTGAMTTSWNSPAGTTPGTASFTLKLRATQAGRLQDLLGISSRFTKAEAYLNDNQVAAMPLDVALRFHDESTASIRGTGFELYPNQPNPFVDKTTISFNLPEAAQATLTIYDEIGRLVYRQKGDFGKGYNVFVLDHQLLQTNGVLLYKVETATDMATGKMIQSK